MAVEKLNMDIFEATQHGDLSKCQELILAGLDVNARNLDGITLMPWAVIYNRIELIEFYISKGAAVDEIGGVLQSTPLHWAIRQGHLSVVLFMQHGANPNLMDAEGLTCIHVAAQHGHTAVIAYLVAKGVNINAPDVNGLTPLMHCVSKHMNHDPARLVQERCTGNTALHIAVYCKNRNETVFLLLWSSRQTPWYDEFVLKKLNNVSDYKKTRPLLEKMISSELCKPAL